MKKNFLYTVLLGTLALTTAGTVTSCKDYDDDIDGLSARIDELQSAVDQINKLIQEGGLISSVESSNNGVIVTLSNGDSFELTNGKDGEAGSVVSILDNGNWAIDGEDQGIAAAGKDGKDGANGNDGEAGSVVSILDNGHWAIDGVDQGIAAAGKDGANGNDGATGPQGPQGPQGDKGDTGNYYVPNAATGYFDLYSAAGDSIGTTEIKWQGEGISAIDNGKTVVLTNVKNSNGEVVSFTINKFGELKSLVLIPALYYHGIEAIEAAGYTYSPKTVKSVSADADNSSDAPTASGTVSVIPDITAEYHINPTSAYGSLLESTEFYSFLTKNVSYTRASDFTPTVKSVSKTSDGILTIKANIKDAQSISQLEAKATEDEGKVAIVALQVVTDTTSSDKSVVTSDYAAIKVNQYKSLALAFTEFKNTETHKTNHLYSTAQEAITSSDNITEVYWDEKDGINLRELVQTHRLNGSDTQWDRDAASGTVEKSGFKYSFELVGWLSGSNKTSESAHAQLQNDYLRPQITSGGKQQAWGANQSVATVGRMPLVRVILTDTISDKIAAVGYMKFQIVERPENIEKAEDEVLFTKTYNFDKEYTVDCTANDIAIGKTVWHQVEEDIIANLGISKETFESDYKIDDTDADEKDVIQYNNNTVSATAKANDKKVGTVDKTTTDTLANMTEVLSWSIKNNAAYQSLKTSSSVETYVRFTKNAVSANGDTYHKYVYVKFVWTPKTRNVAPTGELEDKGGKISNYWYAEGSQDAESGYEEIHGNVEVVGTPDANDEYIVNVLNTFVGNKFNITNVNSAYTQFQPNKLTLDLVFDENQYNNPSTDIDGNRYTLAVDSGGKVLTATKGSVTEKIARITDNSIITLDQSSAFAKALLNNAGHKELAKGQSFTAKLKLNAENCDYVDFTLTNNTFNVKFLRPVDVTSAAGNELLDGQTNGSTAKLKLTFTDWRDHDFTDASKTAGNDYFAYYGIKSISYDKSNITTNLNGGTLGTTKLSSLTQQIVVTYTAPTDNPIKANQYGTVYYTNNGNTVGAFTIRIPFTITYDWGEIKTTVDFKVNTTENNAGRRK